MSAPDGDVPPAGEEIHLPGPSLQPLLLAVGLTLSLVGVTIGLAPLVIGLVMSVWVIIRWIAETRREMSRLPADLGDQH